MTNFMKKLLLLFALTFFCLSAGAQTVTQYMKARIDNSPTKYPLKARRSLSVYPNNPTGTGAFLNAIVARQVSYTVTSGIRAGVYAARITAPSSTTTSTVSTVCSVVQEQCSGNASEIKTFTITLPNAASAPLVLEFKTPEGAGTINLKVNGGSAISLSAPASPGYSSLSSPTVPLNSGANTISVAAVDKFFCVDKVCATYTTTTVVR